MKLNKPQLALLEELYAAEIAHATDRRATLLVQRKNKTTESLEAQGLIAMAETVLPGRFPVTIRGWRLTEAGRITYCQNCDGVGRQQPGES